MNGSLSRRSGFPAPYTIPRAAVPQQDAPVAAPQPQEPQFAPSVNAFRRLSSSASIRYPTAQLSDTLPHAAASPRESGAAWAPITANSSGTTATVLSRTLSETYTMATSGRRQSNGAGGAAAPRPPLSSTSGGTVAWLRGPPPHALLPSAVEDKVSEAGGAAAQPSPPRHASRAVAMATEARRLDIGNEDIKTTPQSTTTGASSPLDLTSPPTSVAMSPQSSSSPTALSPAALSRRGPHRAVAAAKASRSADPLSPTDDTDDQPAPAYPSPKPEEFGGVGSALLPPPSGREDHTHGVDHEGDGDDSTDSDHDFGVEPSSMNASPSGMAKFNAMPSSPSVSSPRRGCPLEDTPRQRVLVASEIMHVTVEHMDADDNDESNEHPSPSMQTRKPDDDLHADLIEFITGDDDDDFGTQQKDDGGPLCDSLAGDDHTAGSSTPAVSPRTHGSVRRVVQKPAPISDPASTPQTKSGTTPSSVATRPRRDTLSAVMSTPGGERRSPLEVMLGSSFTGRDSFGLAGSGKVTGSGSGRRKDSQMAMSVSQNRIEDADGDPLEVDNLSFYGRIGEGASGVVYLAIEEVAGDAEPAEQYAVKQLVRPIGGPKALQEVQAYEKIGEWAHICALHSVVDDTHSKKVLLKMRHCDGGCIATVDERTHRCATLTPAQVCAVAVQMGSALRHCHDRGVAHCDVKPENVLMDKAPPRPHSGRLGDYQFPLTCYLADFGAAVHQLGGPDQLDGSSGDTELDVNLRSIRLIGGGTNTGTQMYLAPECLIGTAAPAPAQDMWALGVMLFTLLFGVHPFASESMVELRHKVSQARLPYPAEQRTNPVLKPWRIILDGLVTKDPARRWTAQELLSSPALARAVQAAAHRQQQQSPTAS